MNKLTTVALSVSMALALGACSPQQEAQSEQSNQQKPAAEKQQEQQLSSGIVLENFAYQSDWGRPLRELLRILITDPKDTNVKQDVVPLEP